MQTTKKIALILGVLVLSLGVGYLALAIWQESTQAPPGGNVDAPVNVSINAQAKLGTLITGYDSSVTTGLIVRYGNVGIGMTTPTQKLDVAGYIKGTGLCIGNDCRTSWPAGDGGGDISGSGTTNYVTKFAGTKTIGNSIIFDNGTNVGIGTVLPQTKLDVAGAIKIGTQDVCDSNTAGAIRYISTQGQERFEGCNGKTWVLIASVSTTPSPPPWSCGDQITFTYKGSSVTYGTVLSQGKCWMDRNLGASRVATAYNDSQSYGDLFQWGRLDDGHQTRTSGKTTTLSSTDVPGHSNFIYGMGFPDDWRSPQNNNLWQGVSGTNNPCPSGWRIPAGTEWNTERLSWSQQNYNGAFASPLKLTAGGFRYGTSAVLYYVGSIGVYWSSTVSGTVASNLLFDGSTTSMDTGVRAHGFSIRCVQD